jgi:hypothetical protein
MQPATKAGSPGGGLSKHSAAFWFRLIFFVGLIPSFLLLLIFFLNPLARIVVMGDDALFLVRYAHNFLTTGSFSWIAGEPPTFGCTSQLYMWLTTGVQVFLKSEEPLSVAILSILGGLFTVVTLLFLLYQEVVQFDRDEAAYPDSSTAPIWLFTVFGIAVVALNAKFYQNWQVGLETTWSVFLVALFVVLLPRFLASRRLFWIGLPFAALLLFWQRPDLGLVGTMPLLVGLALGKERKRTDFSLAGLITAALIAATLIGWDLYYGFPTPLPSIVKTAFSHYSSSNIDAIYAYGNRRELFLFARENFIALAYGIFFFTFSRKLTGKSYSVSEISLGLAALFYTLFETFGNKYPITSGGARFFMPTIPIVMYFAIRGFKLAILRWMVKHRQVAGANFRSSGVYRLGVVAIAGLLAIHISSIVKNVLVPGFRDAQRFHLSTPREAVLQQVRAREGVWTPLLPEIENPAYDHCSMADSELGGIGLMPPSRLLFDLSGLNNTDIVVHHESIPHYLLRKQPDYIWYKRIDFYWGLTLENDPEFRALYDFHPDSGVALRRGSGCPIG